MLWSPSFNHQLRIYYLQPLQDSWFLETKCLTILLPTLPVVPHPDTEHHQVRKMSRDKLTPSKDGRSLQPISHSHVARSFTSRISTEMLIRRAIQRTSMEDHRRTLFRKRFREAQALSPICHSKASALAIWKRGAPQRELSMRTKLMWWAALQTASKSPITAEVSYSYHNQGASTYWSLLVNDCDMLIAISSRNRRSKKLLYQSLASFVSKLSIARFSDVSSISNPPANLQGYITTSLKSLRRYMAYLPLPRQMRCLLQLI